MSETDAKRTAIEETDAEEALTEALINEMTAAILAAYERLLLAFQSSHHNSLNAAASVSSAKFMAVQAAFSAAVELQGEKEARESFDLASMDPNEKFSVMFAPPPPGKTTRDQRRAARKQMQKASRKTNRR